MREFLSFDLFLLSLDDEPRDEVVEDLPHNDVDAEVLRSHDVTAGVWQSPESVDADIILFL